MYKDPDKQREANKQSKERWKAKKADAAVREALGIPKEGIPEQGIPPIKRIPKRGLDIKCFADLPPDVQQTIDMMSRRDGKIDPMEKIARTSRAIRYQHLFPSRYHSTGVAI